MKRAMALASVLSMVLILACGGAAATAEPTVRNQPTDTPPPATATVTPTLEPADVAFSIDCSALEAARQPECGVYLATTRDLVYPLLRTITGVRLSDCYKEIRYTIVPGATSVHSAGGFASGDEITYSAAYSLNLAHPYDVHELLHSISQCSGALDAHIFHGMIMNYVYDKLGVHDIGFFTDRANPADLNAYLLEVVQSSSGNELQEQCRGILSNQMTILYFDLGEGAIQKLYRSTMGAAPQTAPNAQLTSAWGGAAGQVQALLETLEQDFQMPFDVPACGY